MAAVKTGARYLIEVHGDFWNPNPRYAASFWRQWLAATLLVKADGIRVVSHRVSHHLLCAISGVRLSHIFKLPVPVTIPSSAPVTAQRAPDRVQALFVGRLSPEKGLEEFLGVFARVAHEVPGLFLTIVGDGPERMRLEACARALGLTDRVSFVGWVRDPSVSFQEADFLVLPSYHESWGRVVIEALGAGLPVLMTDVGCAGEVVQHEKNGLVVPVGDVETMALALKRMAVDGDLRRQLGAQARSSIEGLPTREQAVQLYRQFWLGSQDT